VPVTRSLILNRSPTIAKVRREFLYPVMDALNWSSAEVGGTRALTRTPVAGLPVAVRTTPVMVPLCDGRVGICASSKKTRDVSLLGAIIRRQDTGRSAPYSLFTRLRLGFPAPEGLRVGEFRADEQSGRCAVAHGVDSEADRVAGLERCGAPSLS